MIRDFIGIVAILTALYTAPQWAAALAATIN